MTTMKRTQILSNKGFTIVEALIGLGILGFLATSATQFSMSIATSVNTEAAKADRNVENLEMLKLVTQPIYFGALSNIPENSQLKECMTLDTKLCDSSLEYHASAYDLNTNQILNTASSAAANIRSGIRFKVHCARSEATCDKADYFTVIVTTYLTYSGIPVSSIEKRDVVTPELTNVVTYIPEATLSAGRPINVVIFLDNSWSMGFAKDQIKAGLDSLIAKLSKMDATVVISTLTDQYTMNTEMYYFDGTGARTSPVPTPYPPTFYSDWNFMAAYPGVYNMEDPATFMNSYPRKQIFKFLANDSVAATDQKILALKNLVDYLFTLPASGLGDTPFCSMLRFLETPTASAPFTLDKFTPTAFFVISNEDDTSSSCQKKYVIEWHPSPPRYHYYGLRQTLPLNITFQGLDDGAPRTYTTPIDYYPVYNPALVPGSDCVALANSTPVADIEQDIKRDYRGQNYVVGSGYTINSCTVPTPSPNRTYYLGSSLTPTDICTQVENGTFSNISRAYVPGSCYEYYNSGDGNASGSFISTEYLVTSATPPVETVFQSISSKVGLSNAYYMAVVHPDTTTCPQTPGSGVGTRYTDLAKKTGMNSSIIPVCSADFSGQLANLTAWTQAAGANDIQLSVTVASSLNGVEIIRAGVSIPLVAKVDYTVSGTILIFTAGILQPNDIVKVYMK